MLVVLDGECLIKALGDPEDPDKLLETLIMVCDQIAFSDNILNREYRGKAFSNVLPKLAQLEEMEPKRKAIKPRLGRSPEIQLRRHHEDLFRDAIRMGANYLVTHMASRGHRSDLYERLTQQFSLTVLSPAAYVAMRSRNR